ncbi:acid-sensing ion channel 4, partial [Homalodisca vitripennis]|uniref:acid-sensing ion channel 4 n=1 Tax=Homalodisca vitripennis TaxID=197043 RepID=UPI001EECD714
PIQKNAISFVVETTYLDVETSFPSISVCEDDNMPRIYEMANQFFGAKHDYNLDEMLREIAYFKGSVYYIKNFCLSDDISCPKDGYKKMAYMVRSKCKEMFKSCRWKNQTFDCCSHFIPLQTEWGVCFTLNSKNEPPGKFGSLKLKSSTRLGLGSLYLELLVPTKVYMHSESDIPYYNTMTTEVITAKAGAIKRLGISVTDIENEPEVRQLTISQRGCRFPDENDLTVSTMYSYSACVTQCRLVEQLKNCNCSSHLMPYTEDALGLQGGFRLLVSSRLPGTREFNIIETIMLPMSDEDKDIAAIEIYMYRHPSERYKRNVVRGRLDLVVSMGGSAGLFVGASLLSFAEFVYYFTMRAYNNHMLRNDQGTVNRTTTPITNVAPYAQPSPIAVTRPVLPPPKDFRYDWKRM